MLKEALLDDDEAARTRITADLDTTFLVEAGAGSGKTTSIVGRMIALVRTGKSQARQIAAITFTNKAAAELRGRFRMKLERELREAPLGHERDALLEALSQLSECFIGTIHAFCGRLLRERPIEAKLDPAFQEMDETEDVEFRDRCWDNYLDLLRTEGAYGVFEELHELDVTVEDLRAVYSRVSNYEDVEIYTEPADRPDFDRLRDSLFPLLDEALPYIPTTQPEKDWDVLQKTIRSAKRYIGNKDMSDDRNLLALAKLFDRSLNVTQNRWTEPKLGKQIKEKFEEWQIETLQPVLQQWREFLHPKLLACVLPAVQYSTRMRSEAGRLNFQDLLMKAAELLRTYPGVRRYFANRYTRLFVDEFQDTDPIQAEMMLLLTGSEEGQSDWRSQLPRPGSLFVVGDPKQSIYRFRRADISTYNFVKHRIEASGAVLQLTRNYRSVKAIGDFVNYAFESKFAAPGERSDHQAPFVRMITQQANPGGRAVRHGVYTMTVPKQERDRQADIAAYDADRIAQFVAWACDGNITVQDKGYAGAKPVTRPALPRDFLILLKARKFIHRYAEKLEQYGIISDTSGSRAIFEELGVLHLLALALGDPGDRIPLLAVLRGKLFGISDDELYHYRQEGGSISLYSNAAVDQLSDKGRKADLALRKLRQYAEWVHGLQALAALTQIVNDIGLLPAAAVGESGAIRSGTLIKLFEVLQADPEACLDWMALTNRLRLWSEGEGLEATSLFAGSDDAVRIMNLHKAKGLEAPIVIMACPCGDKDYDAEEHIDRLSEPPQGYFTISKPRDAYTSEIIAQPAGWAANAEKERVFMHAESERLLYVAATRAKQLLLVSQYPSKPAIDPWRQLAVSLQHQPEMDLTPVAPVRPEQMKTAPNIEEASAKWTERLEAGSRPTYLSGSVTGLTKAASEIVIERSAGGKGMAYGSLMHRGLQAMGEGMDAADLKDYMEMAAADEGVQEAWVLLAEDTVRSVMASELWQRSLRALRKHHEFSFLTVRQVESEAARQGEAGEVTAILRGVIDLAFEEPDGWVIVDFKTDRYALEQETQLIAYYRPQVQAYVEEWTRTVGGKVKESGLYFIDQHRYVEL